MKNQNGMKPKATAFNAVFSGSSVVVICVENLDFNARSCVTKNPSPQKYLDGIRN